MARSKTVSIDNAAAALTDPANLSELGGAVNERKFSVKQKRVLSRLRDAGAGKAEARSLALQALEKLGGEVVEGSQRGGVMARRTEPVESWVIPGDVVAWD